MQRGFHNYLVSSEEAAVIRRPLVMMDHTAEQLFDLRPGSLRNLASLPEFINCSVEDAS
jgi:hypothetical protein